MDFEVAAIVADPAATTDQIDLYTPAVHALAALHNSGRHAIAYGTVGDAEDFRGDYQQMVDFDNSCGGCFIGKAFSKTFPNEYYVSINNDKGQADFMRKNLSGKNGPGSGGRL
jgi:hypothetical protein